MSNIEYNMDGVDNLRIAIVLQAVKDYKRVLHRIVSLNEKIDNVKKQNYGRRVLFSK